MAMVMALKIENYCECVWLVMATMMTMIFLREGASGGRVGSQGPGQVGIILIRIRLVATRCPEKSCSCKFNKLTILFLGKNCIETATHKTSILLRALDSLFGGLHSCIDSLPSLSWSSSSMIMITTRLDVF